MPLGFKSRHTVIEDAIQNATNRRVLIFASPSNWGNTRGHAFPGNLGSTLKVMTMFATSPMCKPDITMNPAPFKSALNFAILGLDVRIPSIDGVHQGTSISTVLGAAFAARLIDFARHEDCREELDNGYPLQELDGMASIFLKTVQEDQGYHCIRPWMLIRDDKIDSKGRSQKRQVACRTIADALNRRDNLK